MTMVSKADVQTNIRLVPPPTIRRLACTAFFDDLECSQDHSKVRVERNGDARCAYGHTWTGQTDQYGRRSEAAE